MVIQLMKFYLRTGYGDSTRYHGGWESALPYQGVCQGNGAGPAIWLAVSAALVIYLYSKGCATEIRSPLSMAIITLVGILYVNDTDLFASDSTPQETISRMQSAVEAW